MMLVVKCFNEETNKNRVHTYTRSKDMINATNKKNFKHILFNNQDQSSIPLIYICKMLIFFYRIFSSCLYAT